MQPTGMGCTGRRFAQAAVGSFMRAARHSGHRIDDPLHLRASARMALSLVRHAVTYSRLGAAPWLGRFRSGFNSIELPEELTDRRYHRAAYFLVRQREAPRELPAGQPPGFIEQQQTALPGGKAAPRAHKRWIGRLRQPRLHTKLWKDVRHILGGTRHAVALLPRLMGKARFVSAIIVIVHCGNHRSDLLARTLESPVRPLCRSASKHAVQKFLHQSLGLRVQPHSDCTTPLDAQPNAISLLGRFSIGNE